MKNSIIISFFSLLFCCPSIALSMEKQIIKKKVQQSHITEITVKFDNGTTQEEALREITSRFNEENFNNSNFQMHSVPSSLYAQEEINDQSKFSWCKCLKTTACLAAMGATTIICGIGATSLAIIYGDEIPGNVGETNHVALGTFAGLATTSFTCCAYWGCYGLYTLCSKINNRYQELSQEEEV